MKAILEFFQDNYLVLDIIAGVLAFALIGYIAERFSTRDVKIKSKKTKDVPNVNMTSSEPIEKL